MWRPSRRFSSVISSSRPASMRVLHQAPPPVATSVTRSPSRTPVRQELARPRPWRAGPGRASGGCRRRPPRTCGRSATSRSSVRGDARPLAAGTAEAVAGTWIGLEAGDGLRRRRPRTARSPPWRGPVIGAPFLSVTTTSTVTCSTCGGELGLAAARRRGGSPRVRRGARRDLGRRPGLGRVEAADGRRRQRMQRQRARIATGLPS